VVVLVVVVVDVEDVEDVEDVVDILPFILRYHFCNNPGSIHEFDVDKNGGKI
jgi:hypothetical protein